MLTVPEAGLFLGYKEMIRGVFGCQQSSAAMRNIMSLPQDAASRPQGLPTSDEGYSYLPRIRAGTFKSYQQQHYKRMFKDNERNCDV